MGHQNRPRLSLLLLVGLCVASEEFISLGEFDIFSAEEPLAEFCDEGWWKTTEQLIERGISAGQDTHHCHDQLGTVAYGLLIGERNIEAGSM